MLHFFALHFFASGLALDVSGRRIGAAPLTVPAVDVVQHGVWTAPADAAPGPSGLWQLREAGSTAPPLSAQRVPAIAADGTAAADRRYLLATIPPGQPAETPRQFTPAAAPPARLPPRSASKT